MKKLLAILMALTLVVCLCACSSDSSTDNGGGTAKADFKVGVITIGDDTEGYTKAHKDGIRAAAKTLGLADSQIIWKENILENAGCSDAADELAAMGCKVIFSNSYGHQTYIAEVAKKYSDVTFVSMTGDFAAISGISNFKNAFTSVYQSRYISGVVAGLKLKELTEKGTLTKETQPGSFDKNGNIKVGYVGAFPFAEVVSGYTAFYLGIKSVCENVAMQVTYTQSWFDVEKEGAAAEALIADGCVIIGQHADSTGAPAATEAANKKGTIAYSVGYNVSMLEVAPNAALTSATNNWSVYYTYAIKAVMDGKAVDTNWAKGYAEDAVSITELGTACAEGTAAAVEAAVKGLKDGTVKVFDTSKFTVSTEQAGVTVDADKHVTSCKVDLSYYDYSTGSPVVVYQGDTVETIADGAFEESVHRSAPYFAIRIDGITENEIK
ncbi:MAG: BMP family ABC transporter substrate-binding protein [Clostridia bacterium]|nr:BMP family ABC transporter substrate-binding protein [Clostridia bacterium]